MSRAASLYDVLQLRQEIFEHQNHSLTLERSDPTILSGNTNDWSIREDTSLHFIEASLAVNVTGIADGTDGRFLILVNKGTFTITFTHEDGASTATNRFHFSTAATVALPAKASLILVYDSVLLRWKEVGQSLFMGAVRLGRTLLVDDIYGADATALREQYTRPFKTPAAAIAVALSGDTILIGPGNFDLSAGIMIPTGVTIRGLSSGTTTLRMLGVGVSTTLVTMGDNTRLEDITLQLTSALHVNLTAILFPGITSGNAKMRRMVVTADNSGAPAVGTSDVFAVRSIGTGTPGRETNAIRACTLIAKTIGSGKARGLLVDTAAHNFSFRDVNMLATLASGAGTAISMEVNQVGAVASFDSGTLNSSTADISQTAGTLEMGSSVLINKSANGKNFKATENSALLVWADDAALPSNATRFMRLGTAPVTATEIKLRMPRGFVVKSLFIRAVSGPGLGKTDTFTVRKNGVDTLLTASLVDLATSVSNIINSVDFDENDDISLKVVTAIATGTSDAVVEVEIY